MWASAHVTYRGGLESWVQIVCSGDWTRPPAPGATKRPTTKRTELVRQAKLWYTAPLAPPPHPPNKSWMRWLGLHAKSKNTTRSHWNLGTGSSSAQSSSSLLSCALKWLNIYWCPWYSSFVWTLFALFRSGLLWSKTWACHNKCCYDFSVALTSISTNHWIHNYKHIFWSLNSWATFERYTLVGGSWGINFYAIYCIIIILVLHFASFNEQLVTPQSDSAE